jgi:hypothetical protein
MKSTRPLDERVAEKQARLEEMLKKAKQYEAQLKQLEARQKDEERKKRTHRLIEIGASIESIAQAPVEGESLIRLINYLQRLEARDNHFTKYIGVYPGSYQATDNLDDESVGDF